jgi:hypothetical protein
VTLSRRSLFASAVALLFLPRRVAAEKLLGPVGEPGVTTWTTGWMPMPNRRLDWKIPARAVHFWVADDGTVMMDVYR